MTLTFAEPLGPTPTINIALIGPPKTGKTAGAGSAPGPVGYLNLDTPNATRFARKKYGDEHFREIKIPEVTEEQQSPVLDTLYDLGRAAFAAELATIVIDPISDLYRRLLEEKTQRKLRFGIEHRGDVSTIMARTFLGLCEAPVNFVAVAHEMPVKDEGSGETRVYPFTGTNNTNLGGKLLGNVDIIAYSGVSYAEDGTPTYLAQLTSAKGRPGGDRFDCLADPATGCRELNLAEWVQAIRDAETPTQNHKENK